MTPYQHYFPYFLDKEKFNADLRPFQLAAAVMNIGIEEKVEILAIFSMEREIASDELQPLISIAFGETLMIQDNTLFSWKRYQDGLLFKSYLLEKHDIAGTMTSEFIDINAFEIGTHQHTTQLAYNNLITYIRKPNLYQKESWHEQYVIVLLHKELIRIIPFDRFNETGGDPLYMWPALASFDPDTGMLHGHGMRMESFSLQLDIHR